MAPTTNRGFAFQVLFEKDLSGRRLPVNLAEPQREHCNLVNGRHGWRWRWRLSPPLSLDWCDGPAGGRGGRPIRGDVLQRPAGERCVEGVGSHHMHAQLLPPCGWFCRVKVRRQGPQEPGSNITSSWPGWRPGPGLHRRCMRLLAQRSGRAGACALRSRLTGRTRPRMCHLGVCQKCSASVLV